MRSSFIFVIFFLYLPIGQTFATSTGPDIHTLYVSTHTLYIPRGSHPSECKAILQHLTADKLDSLSDVTEVLRTKLGFEPRYLQTGHAAELISFYPRLPQNVVLFVELPRAGEALLITRQGIVKLGVNCDGCAPDALWLEQYKRGAHDAIWIHPNPIAGNAMEQQAQLERDLLPIDAFTETGVSINGDSRSKWYFKAIAFRLKKPNSLKKFLRKMNLSFSANGTHSPTGKYSSFNLDFDLFQNATVLGFTGRIQ